MEKAKGLSANTLKVIAIVAMTIDHTAWGFVDMFSVLGQVMHLIGRLTIPIMCFFVAEGFRKTKNLNKYIERMVIFSVISFVPFYLFFHEEYGYRQNFILDLLLALLTLTVLENNNIKKVFKVLLTTAIFGVSVAIGGWPVLPILLVLIFYYVKDFKKQCILVAGAVLLIEAVVILFIHLNNKYGFYPMYQDWVWWEYLYFLGFIFALPLLRLYNGTKGKYPVGRYFFFLYYPAHFFVLWSVRQFLNNTSYNVYIGINVLCLAVTLIMGLLMIKSHPSKAQIAGMLFSLSGVVYMLGFIFEIISPSIEMAYTGLILQYFGECIVYLSFFWFVSEMCQIKTPSWVYGLAGVFSTVVVYWLFTTRSNKFFYTNIEMLFSGDFHRVVLSYGPGWYLCISYIAIMCIAALTYCIIGIKRNTGLARKRIILVLLAMACPWIVMIMWKMGATKGYEISAIGIMGSCIFAYLAMFKYGYFNSVQLAGENALYRIRDGIIVIGNNERIIYANHTFKKLFSDVKTDTSLEKYPELCNYITGDYTDRKVLLEKDNYIYEPHLLPLIENGIEVGKMFTFEDATEHYTHLREAEKFARMDGLTGLYNRTYFKVLYAEYIENNKCGYLCMIDLDNFKGVNDKFGHGVGDLVLTSLAEVLKATGDMVEPCRIGGDEFCVLIKNTDNDMAVEIICQSLIDNFAEKLKESGYEGITSISIGAASLAKSVDDLEFDAVYRIADNALYEAKNNGKSRYVFSK